MGLDRKGYYTLKDIKKENCQYNIILGERSPGKSYAVKCEALEHAFKTKTASLGLLRRFDEDIKNYAVTEYFGDNNQNREGCKGDIFYLTKGEYDTVASQNSIIYFGNTDDNGKFIAGRAAGKAFALSADERYKSRQFPDIYNIIYEEFVTNKLYLRSEPDRLQNFVSTLLRKREGRVWLVANTISRVCPYFQQWSLQGIPKMKEGQIDRYRIDETDIAVEMSPSRKEKSKMFFGKAAKSIQGGQWETDIYPDLPKRHSDYDVIYKMYITAAGFTFTLELLIDDNGDSLCFVYPFTKTVKEYIPHITDIFSSSYNTRRFLSKQIPAEVLISKLVMQGKICFSSNLTGSDFTAAIRSMQGGLIAK